MKDNTWRIHLHLRDMRNFKCKLVFFMNTQRRVSEKHKQTKIVVFTNVIIEIAFCTSCVQRKANELKDTQFTRSFTYFPLTNKTIVCQSKCCLPRLGLTFTKAQNTNVNTNL